MKYVILIIHLFVLSVHATEVFEKSTKEDFKTFTKRHKQLVKVLDNEYRLISKLLKGKRRNSSKLHYRRLELFSEKLKLTFEYENKKFLTDKPGVRKRKGKASYFNKTRNLYRQSLVMGEKILKKFNVFKRKAEVYYTLGLNSRDYGKDNKAAKYLLQAIKIAKRSEPVYFAAKATLADYFYNEKKYHYAIPYYEDVIKNTNSEWTPKYSYNLSWCYLKKKKFPLAIKTIKQAYFKSGKEGMIDVSSQVLLNIGIFYAYAQKVEDGIDFYVKNADEPVFYLKKMGKMLMSRGLFTVSEKAFLQGIKLSKERSERIEINVMLLGLYKQFVKIQKHFSLAKTLYGWHKEKPFGNEEVENVSEKLNNFVSYLQLKVSQKIYDTDSGLQAKKMNMVVGYFKMLSEIDIKKAANYLFLMGETYYSLEKFEIAMSVYKRSLKLAVKDKKEEKLKTQILDSMLSVLGLEGTPKPLIEKYLTPTYANYLIIFPKGEKSQVIYRNIFHELMKKKKITQAKNYLNKYHRSYPLDLNFQRGMATTIIESHVKNKRSLKLASWIKSLRKGYLTFPEETIEKSELILGQILFEDYQKLVSEGKRKLAIQGYKSLFESSIYSKKIKAKAAYNASQLSLDLENIEDSYQWIRKALPLFEEKEIIPLSSSIESMVVEYSERLDFKVAAKLSEYALTFFCDNPKIEKNTYFHFSSVLNFLEGKRKKSLSHLASGQRCGISLKQQEKTERQIIELGSLSENHKFFFGIYKFFSKKKKYENEMQKVLFQMYKFHGGKKGNKLARRSKKILVRDAKNSEFANYMQGYFETEKFVEKYDHYQISDFVQEELFDEKLYNSWLQEKIANITKITDEGIKLSNLGHGDLRVSIFKILNLAYNNLSKKISLITPLGKKIEYVKAFKENMKGIQVGLTDKAYEYTSLAKKQIASGNIINEDGSWALTPKISPVQISYSYIYSGVLMDSAKGI